MAITFGFSRTRGGDPYELALSNGRKWFFPHTRGWSRRLKANEWTTMVFPAHAGVIPLSTTIVSYGWRFSRTRGGDPSRISFKVSGDRFFPHTRGWSRIFKNQATYAGVFPAHAGVILRRLQKDYALPCFSRTRGGDPRFISNPSLFPSFFPHTRGWSRCNLGAMKKARVFPAHAGVIPNPSSKAWSEVSFSRTRGGDPTNLGQMEIRQYQSIGWGLFLDLLISWLLFKYCRCKQHILKIEML